METCYLCLDKTTHIKCNTCNYHFCVTCSKYYHKQETNKNHNYYNLPCVDANELKVDSIFCNNHPTQLLKFYCRTCNYKLICYECMNESDHKTHSFFTYKDIIDRFSMRLVEFENEYQHLLFNSSTLTNSLKDLMFHRELSFHESKNQIKEQFLKLEEKLNQKKNFLLTFLDNLHNIYKEKLSFVTEESNVLIDQLNDKFLELGNFSLTERNDDILNQQKKLDEMNEFLEKGKQLNHETNLYLNKNSENLKIIPKFNSDLAIKSIDQIWFSEVQQLIFSSYQLDDKFYIENLDKFNFTDLFSEIREINHSIVFNDLDEYVNQEKSHLIEFGLDSFNEFNKLEFQFKYINSDNFITYNTIIQKPYSLLSAITYLNHYDGPTMKTWFSSFTDPITNRLYYTSNYDSICTVLEYISLEALENDVNDYKTIELDEFLDGTYIVAYNGSLYHNITKSNKICMTNLNSGLKEIEFGLKTTCFRNTASFKWGGLNDIAFLIDNKTSKRYVLYQKTVDDKFTQVLEISSSFNFDVNNNFTLPIPKKSIGFCFVYDSIIYIGNYHYKGEIQNIFNLKETARGLQKYSLSFEKAQYIMNINIITKEDSVILLISDLNLGLLTYKVEIIGN